MIIHAIVKAKLSCIQSKIDYDILEALYGNHYHLLPDFIYSYLLLIMY
jgi:hypothetical protein